MQIVLARIVRDIVYIIYTKLTQKKHFILSMISSEVHRNSISDWITRTKINHHFPNGTIKDFWYQMKDWYSFVHCILDPHKALQSTLSCWFDIIKSKTFNTSTVSKSMEWHSHLHQWVKSYQYYVFHQYGHYTLLLWRPVTSPLNFLTSYLHQNGFIQGAFNTLRLRQHGRHFPDDMIKCIFLNENINFN